MRPKVTGLMFLSLAALTACAGFGAKKKEQMRSAQQWMQSAERAILDARQAGAATYASEDLRDAEAELRAAKDKFQRRDYEGAGSSAQGASSTAGQAKWSAEEARNEEAAKREAAKKKESQKKPKKK
ncbi:MAG: hypothetical protein HY551_06850 [Elusimicrobia bacterium]|nr:hypothetical protein [Elusimicrobiota bacterium]